MKLVLIHGRSQGGKDPEKLQNGWIAGLRKGLKGRAELRPTSSRWAWVEYVMAQCGPEAGLAAYDAWKADRKSVV